MKSKIIIGLLTLISVSATANESNLCKVKLENNDFGKVSINGYIKTNNNFSQSILQALHEKGYKVDPSSEVTLSFRISQGAESAKTLATLNWSTPVQHMGMISLGTITGKVPGRISMGVAYQSEHVDFSARQGRAVNRMLQQLPTCP